MLEITTREDGVTLVAVTADMTIYNATEINAKLFDEVRKVQKVQIDLSNVSEFDTSGLQILMALKSDSDKTGRSYSVSASNPAIDKLVDLYNAYEQISLAKGSK